SSDTIVWATRQRTTAVRCSIVSHLPVIMPQLTTEQFRSEYHLLDRVAEGAVETYHAQAATGAMVMVHYLRGSAAETAEIEAAVEGLDPEKRRKVLSTVEVDEIGRAS